VSYPLGIVPAERLKTGKFRSETAERDTISPVLGDETSPFLMEKLICRCRVPDDGEFARADAIGCPDPRKKDIPAKYPSPI
jgi:hypothetical protein